MCTFKERVLSVMEKAVECYSLERLDNYISKVKQEGLTEHGFARVGANLGILIVNGRKKELYDKFLKIVDICCEQIPKVKANNDFTVRELVCMLLLLEKTEIVSKRRLNKWKNQLSSQTALNLYKKVYTQPGRLNNWAVFAAVSEWMRVFFGINGERDFVENQLATQTEWFDENGMYLDPNNPMLYDLATRLLFGVLLNFEYDGKYRHFLDNNLEKAGLITLKMQSVTGEMPFGGRSNQFLHNEATLVSVFAYEAKRWQNRGDLILAGQFKRASILALEAIERWLEFAPERHIKNFYAQDSLIGCEGYGYFDKYMVTLASTLYPSILYDLDDIEEVDCPAQTGGYVATTSSEFHKTFMNEGGYFLQFDVNADEHYDGSGLGRIHKKGTPSAICLSVPFATVPKYKIERQNPAQFSICPAVKIDGEWVYGADSQTEYQLIDSYGKDGVSTVKFKCCFSCEKVVEFVCSVDKAGVILTASSLDSDHVGVCFPAFYFDGEKHAEIITSNDKITVKYAGSKCDFFAQSIVDLSQTYYNRNGEYKGFLSQGKGCAQLKIQINNL